MIVLMQFTMYYRPPVHSKFSIYNSEFFRGAEQLPRSPDSLPRTPDAMRLGPIGPLCLSLLIGCGGVTAEVSGEISAATQSCTATIDGDALMGPEGGVRTVARAVDPEDEASRHVLVIYCLLSDPESEPARVDFVKRDAPPEGVLEPGSYEIDTEGDQPRTIGVVVTAPEYLDGTRNWEPISGTLQIVEWTPTGPGATFQMELRSRGPRTY